MIYVQFAIAGAQVVKYLLEKKLDCLMGQCTGIDCHAQEFVLYLGKDSKQERCSQVFKLGRFLYYHLEEGESMEDSVFTHSGPQASVCVRNGVGEKAPLNVVGGMAESVAPEEKSGFCLPVS